MRLLFSILPVLLSTCLPLAAVTSSGAMTDEETRARIEATKAMPREERLEVLGDLLRWLPERSVYPNQETARPMYEDVLREITSIPGHANYFGDKLAVQEEKLLSPRPNWNQYLRERLYIFRTLQAMPSPDAVKLLASYLTDNRHSPDNPYPNQPPPPDFMIYDNSYYAVDALGNLGIEGGVSKTGPVRKIWKDGVVVGEQSVAPIQTDRPRWIQWWKEVQEGKRTYRFAGSPIEYGANGPVAATSSPRAEPTRTTPAVSGQADTAATSEWVKIAAAIGALLLLILAAWRYFQKRKAA